MQHCTGAISDGNRFVDSDDNDVDAKGGVWRLKPKIVTL